MFEMLLQTSIRKIVCLKGGFRVNNVACAKPELKAGVNQQLAPIKRGLETVSEDLEKIALQEEAAMDAVKRGGVVRCSGRDALAIVKGAKQRSCGVEWSMY